MTLSEIANWHDAVKKEWPGTVEGVFHAHAAATLRKIEGRVAHYEKAFANAQNADAEANGLLLAKLKIATEALEDFAKMDDPYVSQYASAALARIKEVG